ncbi:MAG TPA: DUF4331 domain-containing protein [Verrucomicrobiae bacterium]|jgi:hypothetical protein
MKKPKLLHLAATLALAVSLPIHSRASSHMDAPLIVLDPAANTTDVYAFVDVEANGSKHLTVALGVYPHQEPGIGPNKYNFDDNVLYEIHVALGNDRAAGRPTLSYQFQFKTAFKNSGTILQSYLGVINNVGDNAQNLVQSYTVTKVDHRTGARTALGTGVVPPNNQGIATPFYNQGDNGNNPAKDGVSTFAALDRYTQQAITNLAGGYTTFAGQRDDGFYADIGSIFDLLQLRSPGKDSQGGYNLHLMALEIPVSELGGDQQVAGVYATTSRRQIRILREDGNQNAGNWVQVARQGNPLFNEGLVAIADKDRYSRTSPSQDSALFAKYALNPELAKLINLIVFGGSGPAPESNRTDIAGIYIPDLIKVDLSTPGVRFAGSGAGHPTNPDDAGFSRLSIFGGDVLQSQVQDPFGNGGFVPGGWPNGRRFGDDVVDIAVSALISDLRGPLVIRVADGIDGVSKNDIGYNKTFPYEGTPQNGRNHSHP